MSAISFEDLELRVVWAVLVLPLALLSMFVNVMEYQVAARSASHSVGFSEAARVAITGSAANLLPLPGAALTRVQGLRKGGVTTGTAIGANVMIGLVWLGLAGLLASLALRMADAGLWWVVLGGVAIGLLVAAWYLAMRSLTLTAFWQAVVVESLFVAIATTRFLAASRAIGFDSTVEQAFVTPFATAVASAAGILPGGLGMRELFTGLLGLTVGMPASAAALASSLDRLAGIVVLALAAGIVWLVNRHPARSVG